MGILAATTPNRDGVVTSGAAVAATDTVPRAVIGSSGCYLEIINGNAASDNMTISDDSTTTTGAAAEALAPTVVNATSRVFKIDPRQANQTTGDVTVTHSVISTVTYKLYPLD